MKIQRFKDLKIQKFKNSKIQKFKNSKIRRFKPYGIWEFWDFGIFFLLVFSCGRSYNTQQPAQDRTEIERQKGEILLRVHQQLVEEDAREIEAYAERNGWQLKTTQSGLSYMIYENGKGDKAVAGKTATLKYTVSLLDSTVCYSSEQSGHKIFQLGRGEVEAGLDEGVQLMRVGDKARLFLPPHLAHDLTGDGDCIPHRAVILYDVELIKIAAR